MTRERVEQAIEAIREALDITTSAYHAPRYDPNHADKNCTPCKRYEALTTLSNALAESEKEVERLAEQVAEIEAKHRVELTLLMRPVGWVTQPYYIDNEAVTEVLNDAKAESEKERDEMAEALAGWGALASRFGTPTEIHRKLSESEKERERLREALKRLRQEANKDWFNAPDSLCGVIQAITDQALSPDSQEKREE